MYNLFDEIDTVTDAYREAHGMKQLRFPNFRVVMNKKPPETAMPLEVHDDKCDRCGEHMGLHTKWCDKYGTLRHPQNPNLGYEE